VVPGHDIRITERAAPATAAPEVLPPRHAESVGTDDEQPRRGESRLSLFPDLGQDHLARIAIAHTHSSHSRTRASGSGLSVMSVTTDTRSAPAARASGARAGVMPPIAHSGRAPTRRFHSPTRSRPCSCHFIFLRMVGKTGPSAT